MFWNTPRLYSIECLKVCASIQVNWWKLSDLFSVFGTPTSRAVYKHIVIRARAAQTACTGDEPQPGDSCACIPAWSLGFSGYWGLLREAECTAQPQPQCHRALRTSCLWEALLPPRSEASREETQSMSPLLLVVNVSLAVPAPCSVSLPVSQKPAYPGSAPQHHYHSVPVLTET